MLCPSKISYTIQLSFPQPESVWRVRPTPWNCPARKKLTVQLRFVDEGRVPQNTILSQNVRHWVICMIINIQLRSEYTHCAERCLLFIMGVHVPDPECNISASSDCWQWLLETSDCSTLVRWCREASKSFGSVSNNTHSNFDSFLGGVT